MSAAADWQPRFPEVVAELSGRDGNAGAVMGNVVDAMRRQFREDGRDAAEISALVSEFRAEATSGDYDHLLQTCMRWVTVE